ncbi:MAG: hypothetical protein MJ192_07755 [Clostridia bacterium]|nr:hypothetical protein [Clostridia bacterium]
MTERTFRYAMRRGLGRCVAELRTCPDPEKYRRAVLWGCLHNLSFDTQCEGTRARYVYALVRCFPDPESFAGPTVESFRTLSGRDTWLFCHFTDLLVCFAADGSPAALDALRSRYDELYYRLLHRRSSSYYDYLRDDFEHLLIARFISLSDGRQPLKEAAAELGHLFRTNKRYTYWDFEWFLTLLGEKYGKKRMAKLAEHPADEDEAAFAAAYREMEAALEEFHKPIVPPVPPTSGELSQKAEAGELTVSDCVRFRRRADEDEKRALAASIEATGDPEKRAGLLRTFIGDAYPGDPALLTSWAESPCEELREAALAVMQDLSDPVVYVWAKARFDAGQADSGIICILLKNYRSADKERLLAAVRALSVTYDERSGWHGVVMQIKDRSVRLPDEFYLWVYESSLCSCCREDAVRVLGRRGRLTPALLEECLHDSNDEIAAYAARRLRR